MFTDDQIRVSIRVLENLARYRPRGLEENVLLRNINEKHTITMDDLQIILEQLIKESAIKKSIRVSALDDKQTWIYYEITRMGLKYYTKGYAAAKKDKKSQFEIRKDVRRIKAGLNRKQGHLTEKQKNRRIVIYWAIGVIALVLLAIILSLAL
jgi:hypothetical protein